MFLFIEKKAEEILNTTYENVNCSNRDILNLHKELEDAEEEKKEKKRGMALRRCVVTNTDYNCSFCSFVV